MTRRVAYQGAAGAFGEEACHAFLPDWLAVAKPTFAAVVEAVRNGEVDRGMLPLRNNTAGAVPSVDRLIRENGLVLLSSHRLPVRMHLLALPGAGRDGISRVASHPMALAQCRKWLLEAGLRVEEEANTALAAQALARSGDLGKAVIASENAATVYGLAILARGIQDAQDNATTFGIIGPPEGERS
ncbi:MAG: prephenate dehydratase domain-containing protein [Allosphingosinicella sp.]